MSTPSTSTNSAAASGVTLEMPQRIAALEEELWVLQNSNKTCEELVCILPNKQIVVCLPSGHLGYV